MQNLGGSSKNCFSVYLKSHKIHSTEELEPELNVVPMDLRLEKLQWMEAIKPLEKLSIYHQQHE